MSKYFEVDRIRIVVRDSEYFLTEAEFLNQVPRGNFADFADRLQNVNIQRDFISTDYTAGCSPLPKKLKFSVPRADFQIIEPVFIKKIINSAADFSLNIPYPNALMLKLHVRVEAEISRENSYIQINNEYMFGEKSYAANITAPANCGLNFRFSGIKGPIHITAAITHIIN